MSCLHIQGSTDIRSFGHGDQSVFFQGNLRPPETVKSIFVILKKNRNLIKGLFLDNKINGSLCLLIVRRPDIYQIPIDRLPQTVCPGEHSHKGNFSFIDKGNDPHRGRCSHITEKGKYLFFKNQLLRIIKALNRVIPVIQHNQPDLSTMNATGFIDIPNVRHGPLEHLGSQVSRMAAQSKR